MQRIDNEESENIQIPQLTSEDTVVLLVNTLMDILHQEYERPLSNEEKISILCPKMLDIQQQYPEIYEYFYEICINLFSKESVEFSLKYNINFSSKELNTDESELQKLFNYLQKIMFLAFTSFKDENNRVIINIDSNFIKNSFTCFISYFQINNTILLTPLFELIAFIFPNGSFLKYLTFFKLVCVPKQSKQFKKQLLCCIKPSDFKVFFVQKLTQPISFHTLKVFSQDMLLLLQIAKIQDLNEVERLIKQTSFSPKIQNDLLNNKKQEIEITNNKPNNLFGIMLGDEENKNKEQQIAELKKIIENQNLTIDKYKLKFFNSNLKHKNERNKKNKAEISLSNTQTKLGGVQKQLKKIEQKLLQTERQLIKKAIGSESVKSISKQEQKRIKIIKNTMIGIQIRDLIRRAILFFTLSFGYKDSDQETSDYLFRNDNFKKLQYHDEYKAIINSLQEIKKRYNIEAHTIQDKNLLMHLEKINLTHKVPDLHLISKIWKCQLFRDFVQKNDEMQTDLPPPNFLDFLSWYKD